MRLRRAAQRRAADLAVLDGEPSRWPQCRDAFDDGAFRRWWPKALTHQYVQLNTDAFINWLNFDIDRDNSFEVWERANVHPPNAYIQNPDNGHGHLLYGLAAPVGMATAIAVHHQLAAAVQRGMTRRLAPMRPTPIGWRRIRCTRIGARRG